MSVLEVDVKGLMQILERRGGKYYALFELISNTLDEKSSVVTVTLEKSEDKQRRYWLTVEDDNPAGFADLTDAYTLFASSKKKADKSKRGRFNLGEKLVLAICEQAEITSTTGTVAFDMVAGTREKTRVKRDAGTIFKGLVIMTNAEFEEACQAVRRIIPPETVLVSFNGVQIPTRKPLKTFEAKQLQTEVSDDLGFLRKAHHDTTVEVFEVLPGEEAHLYEMGIPVVTTGDKWHVDVQQRVPLTLERDNVPPGFLKTVRTLVVNAMHKFIKPEDAATEMMQVALANPKLTPEAAQAIVKAEYGDKVVIYDPSDREAKDTAEQDGAIVIHGSQKTKEQFENIRKAGVLPAGQVYPTPRVMFSPTGKKLKIVEEKDWTHDMHRMAGFATDLAGIGLPDLASIDVEIANDLELRFDGWWQKGEGSRRPKLTLNYARLGDAWFKRKVSDPKVISLLGHEYAHEVEANHRDVKYHDALCEIFARIVAYALDQPEFFDRPRKVVEEPKAPEAPAPSPAAPPPAEAPTSEKTKKGRGKKGKDEPPPEPLLPPSNDPGPVTF